MSEEFNHKNYNYTWTKGFGIAILLTFILLAGSVFAQTSPNTPSGYSIDSISGNLIPFDSSLKTNTGTWTSTSGSGAGWVPYGSPQGSFNATDGYTFSHIGEEMGIAGISLSGISHGYQNSSAVFVTGFMYGLKYRFPCANSIGGSCTDTSGPQDTLRVEVGYYPSTGPATFYLHQLGLKNQTDGNSAYNTAWQTLAETVTFSGAKPLAQAGSVNMGIYGQDAGFWACLMPDCYGPQVKDVYIRANYSVDPCILNPAFNPSCPGFNTIIQGAQSPLYWHSYNIAQRLPHIGGGVQLHGFDYGFSWANYGACYNTFMFWCTDWRTDGGANINFRITDKSNNVIFVDSQYRSGNNQSGFYSNRYLFTETQNSLNMGNVDWYLTGVWNHLAVAGWTRPIWTPDPCYTQPLYSKNCSNFLDEIKRLAAEQIALQEKAQAQTVANITSTSQTPAGQVTTTITDANTANPTVTNTFTSTETNSVTNTTKALANASSTTATDSKNVSAPRVETTKDSTTSFALGLIGKNQERETSIASQASQSAIKDTEQRALQSVRQAENIAFDSVSKSQDTQQKDEQHQTADALTTMTRTDQIMGAGPAPGSTSVVTQAIQQRTQQAQAVQEPQTVNNNTSTSAIVQFNAMATTVVQPVQMFNPLQPPVFSNPTTASAAPYQPPTQTQISDNRPADSSQQRELTTSSNQTVALLPPQAVTSEVQQTALSTTTVLPVTQVDLPQTQANFLNDKTNPINSILETRTVMPEQERNSTNTQQVKSNVQDNDAAAGVSIASIARTPVGFNSYMVALSDANFYAPKEIYRNQKNVDNARALRQLASDRLHQQMVDQQYLPR